MLPNNKLLTFSALGTMREGIQRAMSRDVAVVRDAEGLARATAVVEDSLSALAAIPSDNRAVWELRNLALSVVQRIQKQAAWANTVRELQRELAG